MQSSKHKTHKAWNLLQWVKLVSITGSSQIMIQAVGIVSGLLIIRFLPTKEYALYTLANTMLGTMNLLSDGGISTGVMSEGGKVWEDREKLGKVLATGLELRKRFAIGSLLIVTPILLYLLRNNEASWFTAILIIVCILPSFLSTLSGSLLEIIPRLHQNIVAIQKNQVSVSLGRLVLITSSITIFPFAYIGLITNGLPQIWANQNLRKITKPYIDWEQEPDAGYRQSILKLVVRIMPGAIYYSFSGQITIWLISISGNTKSIAQVGALGRLALVINIFTVLFNTLVFPRFARLNSDKKLMFKYLRRIQIILILIVIVVVGLVKFFSTEMLFVLGKNYQNLDEGLLLTVIGSSLSLCASVTFGLSNSRGWVMNPLLSAIVSISSIIVGVHIIDVSTLRGVMILNVLTSSINIIVNLIYIVFKIEKIDNYVN